MKQFVPDYVQPKFDLHDRTPKQGITNRCNLPEQVVTIDNQGNCFMCICDAWLPVSVGNILDFDSMRAIWKNDRALALAEDLNEKKFTYCSVDLCGIRTQSQTMYKKWISVNIDESCNLRCPSCRSFPINYTSGEHYQNKLGMVQHISRLLSEYEEECVINMSGNGDPFASLTYRPLLMHTKPSANHEYRIMTNGLLLKKILPKTSILPSISEFHISVDAGNKQTYEKVRLGGKWESITENMKWLVQNVDADISVNFVVQRENWRSLQDFEQWISNLGVKATLTKLENWFTFDFSKNDVLSPTRPEYHDCIRALQSLTYNKIELDPSLKQLVDKA